VVAGHLADAAYRLPQILNQVADWIATETTAGRIGDDNHRPAWQITDDTRALLADAAGQAARLAEALAHARNDTATLHGTAP
jgi:hypothetical protein